MKKLLSLLLCILLVISFGTENVHAAGPEFTVKQVGTELHIESDDDVFLAGLCEEGTVSFYKYIYDSNQNRFGFDHYYLVETFCSDLPTIQEIVKTEDYAKIDIGNRIYNGDYAIGIHYTPTEYNNIFITGCKEAVDVQEEVTVVEKQDGSFLVSCDNDDYINDIYQMEVGDNPVSKNSFDYANDHKSFTFKFDDTTMTNGNVEWSIECIKYKEKKGQINLEHHDLLECPNDINVFINNITGDLEISSNDTDWINALCENRFYLDTLNGHYAEGISGEPGYKNYFFGASNYEEFDNQCTLIEKKNANTVIFSAYAQRNMVDRGGCINGIPYSITIQAKGYKESSSFDITFTNACKILPTDLTFKIVGTFATLHTNDLDFINYLKQFKGIDCGFGTDKGNPQKVIFMTPTNVENEWNPISIPTYPDDNTVLIDMSANMYYQIDEKYCTEGVLLCVEDFYDRIYHPRIHIYDESAAVYSTVEKYNVSFNGNGATGSMDQVQAGGYYSLPENGFDIPSGKEFVGWAVGDDTTERFVGEKTLIFSDKEIKAIWKDLPTPQVTVDDSLITVGSVINATPSENNQNATLGGDVSGLIPTGDVEKGAAVWMEVNPIENTDPDYTRMQRGFALENSGVLMECMEINIFKQIKGNGPEKVSETLNDAIISFDLTGKPELIKLAENGLLFVYNIHNGRVSDLIVGTYNPSTHIYTFTADKFSIFGFFKIGELPPEHHNRHVVLDTGVNR